MNKEYESSRSTRELIINKINPKITEVLLARERTILAKQRVKLSQINTAVAVAALGFAVIRFFESSNFYNIMVPIGIILVAIATIVIIHSVKRYKIYSAKISKLKRFRGHSHNLYFAELLSPEIKN